MRVGIISAYINHHRTGDKYRGFLQPLVGSYIAAHVPESCEIDLKNDTWADPDWSAEYDVLFISCLHSDFDRAKQISAYWRARGTQTVLGGTMASTFPDICRPFFDSVAVGDPEGVIADVIKDLSEHRRLRPLYRSVHYDAGAVRAPRFDLMAKQSPLPLAMEITRGCPYKCDFCALTAVGTRFELRPIENAIRDITHGQAVLEPLVAGYKTRIANFADNNIGGNPRYLRKLCSSLEELNIIWGSAATFNIANDESAVKMMSRAGCRFLYVGVESFNQGTLNAMNKPQNVAEETHRAYDLCRKNGILLVSGLLVSPRTDDCDYMASIPDHLAASGLNVPAFISIECPFPGTPQFRALAHRSTPAFQPSVPLHDFNGYTLVTRPELESSESFIDAYRHALNRSFSVRRKAAKAARDLPRLIVRRHASTAFLDTLQIASGITRNNPDRTYIGGTDILPPELSRVPLTDRDFASQDAMRAVMSPTMVTDEDGAVLPEWLDSELVFTRSRRKTQA